MILENILNAVSNNMTGPIMMRHFQLGTFPRAILDEYLENFQMASDPLPPRPRIDIDLILPCVKGDFK